MDLTMQDKLIPPYSMHLLTIRKERKKKPNEEDIE
jgi:hypothetical protein